MFSRISLHLRSCAALATILGFIATPQQAAAQATFHPGPQSASLACSSVSQQPPFSQVAFFDTLPLVRCGTPPNIFFALDCINNFIDVQSPMDPSHMMQLSISVELGTGDGVFHVVASNLATYRDSQNELQALRVETFGLTALRGVQFDLTGVRVDQPGSIQTNAQCEITIN